MHATVFVWKSVSPFHCGTRGWAQDVNAFVLWVISLDLETQLPLFFGFIFNCVYAWAFDVYLFLWGPEEGIGSAGAGVPDSSEPDVGVGDWPWIRWTQDISPASRNCFLVLSPWDWDLSTWLISITETYQFTCHTLLRASVYKELDEITKLILHKEASDARICMWPDWRPRLQWY